MSDDKFNDDELDDPVLPPDELPVVAPLADTAAAQTTEEDAEPFVPNFTRSFNPSLALKEDEQGEDPISLARIRRTALKDFLDGTQEYLASVGQQEEKLFERAEKLGRLVSPEEGNQWFRVLMGAIENGYDAADGFLSRAGSHWRQEIETPTGTVRVGTPKQNRGAAVGKEQAMFLQRRAGTSTVKDVPLYHSGIWLRFYTPSNVALTAIQQAMGQLKVELGRMTKGLAFSNTSHALMSLALDACLQAVTHASVPFATPSDLKSKISILDAPIILWGLACTIWPQGYDYSHPCTVDPSKCQHIEHARLNLQRMFWTDDTALSPFQRKIMGRRLAGKPTTDEELLKYREEHTRGGTRDFWLENGIGIRVLAPNVQEYEEAGNTWIDGIVTMTQSAFNEPPHGMNRAQYITKLGMQTSASQYRGWVLAVMEKGEGDEDDHVYGDPEVVTTMLDTVFSSDEFLETFLNKVTDYINETVISTVAIDSYDCDKCDASINTKPMKHFPHLVQVDVLMVFFTLIDRKLS